MQSRIQSWALWMSIAALISFVAKTYFKYEIPEFDELVNLILSVLVGFGIINNPTNGESL